MGSPAAGSTGRGDFPGKAIIFSFSLTPRLFLILANPKRKEDLYESD
jgi:hypothetical protein